MHALTQALLVAFSFGACVLLTLILIEAMRIGHNLSEISRRTTADILHIASIVVEAVDVARLSVDAITPHVVHIRGALESVVRTETTASVAREQSRVHVLEAPQVPLPHGEPRTLLLMNSDHTVAHEVTYHREVPKVYAYGGRVFELLGQNESGQWEFLPC